MNKYFYIFFLPFLLFSKNVIFEWENRVIYASDFYQAVPYSEWSALDSLRKINILDDFLHKELISFHAIPEEIDNMPMGPVTMMRNQLQIPGGTKAFYESGKWAHSVKFWQEYTVLDQNAN